MARTPVELCAAVLSSDLWWKPVLGFISTNCGKFSGDCFTHEEYQCFCDFRTLTMNLFDTFIAKHIGVRIGVLETALYDGFSRNDELAKKIVLILGKMEEFEDFRNLMISQNEKIEEEVTNMMLSLQDPAAEMTDVADMLERQEEIILSRQVEEKCKEMRDYFGVKQLSATDLAAVKMAPKSVSSSPSLGKMVVMSKSGSGDFVNKTSPLTRKDSIRSSGKASPGCIKLGKATLIKPTLRK